MLLLNVGPRADGSITEEETAVLKEIGAWMAVNGEGIYGTVPWKQFGEGGVNNAEGFFQDNEEKAFTPEDYRFTYRKGFLYAFCMRPEGGRFTIRSLALRGDHDFMTGRVEVLGGHTVRQAERNAQGLTVTLDKAPASDKPLCFKVEIL